MKKLSREQLSEITENFREIVQTFHTHYNTDGMSNFRHFANNALPFNGFYENPQIFDAIGNLYVKSLKELKDYLQLIAEHQEFREAEFQTPEGYFPDVEKTSISNSRPLRDYVRHTRNHFKNLS